MSPQLPNMNPEIKFEFKENMFLFHGPTVQYNAPFYVRKKLINLLHTHHTNICSYCAWDSISFMLEGRKQDAQFVSRVETTASSHKCKHPSALTSDRTKPSTFILVYYCWNNIRYAV